MPNELRTEVEQVKQQEEVKRALKQTSTVKPETTPAAETKDKLLLGTHAIIFFALAVVRFILESSFFGFAAKHPKYIELLQKLDLSAMSIILLLAVAKIVDVYLIGRIDSPVSRYNLRRVAKLSLVLVLAFVVVSILFQNWYTAAVSLGLLSLIMGFALQTPITTFIARLYLLPPTPYRSRITYKPGPHTRPSS